MLVESLGRVVRPGCMTPAVHQRVQAGHHPWRVLAQLRYLEIDKKLFRPDMHNSFWLAWAAANVPADEK